MNQPSNKAEFWKKFPGLVWSNSKAPDAAYIRQALLRARFDVLLPAAAEFGVERLESEWNILRSEPDDETGRVTPRVERMLRNIRRGFELATS